MKKGSNNDREGYKLTELGWIPQDWEVMRLRELGDFYGGGTPSTANPAFWNGTIPWVSPKDMKAPWISVTEDYVTEEAINLSSTIEVPSGSVLIVTRSGILRTKVPVAVNTVRVAINQDLKALVFSDAQTAIYIFHYLRGFNHALLLAASKVGTTVESLDYQSLKDFSLPLPPTDERNRLISVLELWDRAIAAEQALITVLGKRHRALVQQLLTGRQRLAGFEGEWKEYRLDDLFARVTRKNTERNTTVVTISAQRGFVMQNDFFNKTVASDITDGYFLVERGEFCYNKSYSNGYPWGATKRLCQFEKAVVTTLYICFGVREETKTSAEYFEYFFESGLLDKGLMKVAHEGGRAHGLLNVTPSDFFGLKVFVPPTLEQSAIAKVLSASEKETATHKQRLSTIKAQKQALMQKLLTGSLRVLTL